MFAAHRTFLLPSLLCTSFVFQHLGFWNGPRMPVELPGLDKAPLCLRLHRPFRINQGGNRKSAPPLPPFFTAVAAGQGLEHAGWSAQPETAFCRNDLWCLFILTAGERGQEMFSKHRHVCHQDLCVLTLSDCSCWSNGHDL